MKFGFQGPNFSPDPGTMLAFSHFCIALGFYLYIKEICNLIAVPWW